MSEHGYAKDHIREALAECGPDVRRAVEFCIARAHGAQPTAGIPKSDPQEIARNTIVAMGFEVPLITAALEASDFDFGKALLSLLAGIDDHTRDAKRRRQYELRSKRREKTRTAPLHELVAVKKLKSQQYKDRARDELRLDLLVCDFGMEAGRTCNACFWLSLAAAWSFIDFDDPLNALEDATREDRRRARALLQSRGKLSERTVQMRNDNENSRDDAVGRLAAKLRHHFCGPHEEVSV